MIDWEHSSKDWDPMKEDSDSIRNHNAAFVTIDEGNSVQKFSDISCPFQKEPHKHCFKGRSCPYKHGPYTPKMKTAHPKLQDRPTSSLTIAKNLPRQRGLAEGVVTHAWVTSVVNPAQFYVVLKNGHNCLCQTTLDQECEDKLQRNVSGLEELGILWRNMQLHYSLVKERPMQYFEGELIAVRLDLGGGGGPTPNGRGKSKGWFRAVVLDDTDPDLDADQAPDVTLKLLDYGMTLVKNTVDVAPLHEKFGNDAPMAVYCSLFGISPLLGKWGRKGSELFKELVSGQVILLEVKGQSNSLNDSLESEECLVQVSLYAKSNGKFVGVCRQMGKLGLGVEWNPTPTRPWVSAQFLRDDYALKKVWTESDQETLAEKTKTALEQENLRLKAFIATEINDAQ